MGSADFERYLAFDASLLDADEPLDAGMLRAALNNLRHAYDGAMQHRINYAAQGGPVSTATALHVAAPFGKWAPVNSPAGVFPVTLRAGGALPRAVVNLSVRWLGAADVLVMVWWRVVRQLRLIDIPPAAGVGVPLDRGVAFGSAPTGSTDWVALDTTLSTGESFAVVELAPPLGEPTLWPTSESDGASVDAEVYLTRVDVYARASDAADASDAFFVRGLTLREFSA